MILSIMACLQKGRDYRHLATFSVVMETTAKIESVENVMGVIYLFIYFTISTF